MAAADNIKVAVKMRPLNKREKDNKMIIQWRITNDTIKQNDHNEQYSFDHIFGEESSTLDVFDKIAKPIVDATLKGFNGTIFAYGQTSSGKTYTMLGDDREPGIMVLAVKEIFKEIEASIDREFLLRVGYIEIYNEKIYDLLDKKKFELKVHENSRGEVHVNHKECIVSTSEVIMSLMETGSKERIVGETNMNERSSRSHTIFRIIIESRGSDKNQENFKMSHLNLVDLAGSERADQTRATGSRLKEGGHINKSLLSLSCVIQKLSENDSDGYINYRDSKLTRILQASLGGNAMTAIICTVTPAAMEETYSTLCFATRARAIKNKPIVNEVISDTVVMKRLEKEIARLQYELKMEKNKNSTHKQLLEKQILERESQILTSRHVQKDKNRRRTWCPAVTNNTDSFMCMPNNTTKVISEQSVRKTVSIIPTMTSNELFPTTTNIVPSPVIPTSNTDAAATNTPKISSKLEELSVVTPNCWKKLNINNRETFSPRTIKFNNRIAQLEAELDDLKNFTNLEKLICSDDTDQHEIVLLTTKLKDAYEELAKYKREHEELLKYRTGLLIYRDDISENQLDRSDSSENMLAKMKLELSVMDDRTKELERAKDIAETNLLKANKCKEFAEMQKTSIEFENEQYKFKTKTREKELVQELNKSHLWNDELKLELSSLKNRLLETEGINWKYEKRIEKLQEDNSKSIQNSYQISKGTVLKNDNIEGSMNHEINPLKSKYDTLQFEYEELSSQFMDCVQENDNGKKQISELETLIGKLREEKNQNKIDSEILTQLKQQSLQLQNQFVQWDENIMNIKSINTVLMKNADELRISNENLTQDINALNVNLDMKTNELNKCSLDIESLNIKLKEQISMSHELINENNSLKNELLIKCQSLDQLEKDHTEQNLALKNLRNICDGDKIVYNKNLNNIITELDHIKEENSKINAEKVSFEMLATIQLQQLELLENDAKNLTLQLENKMLTNEFNELETLVSHKQQQLNDILLRTADIPDKNDDGIQNAIENLSNIEQTEAKDEDLNQKLQITNRNVDIIDSVQPLENQSNKTISDLDVVSNDLCEQIKTLSVENAALQTELEKLLGEKENLTLKITQSKQDVNSLESLLNKSQLENTEQMKLITNLQNNIERLQTTLANLQCENSKLQKLVDEITQEKNVLYGVVENNRHVIEQTEYECNSMRTSYLQCIASINKLQEENELIKSDAETRIKKYIENNQELVNSLEKIKLKSDNYSNDIDTLSKLNVSLTTELQELKQSYSILESTFKEKELKKVEIEMVNTTLTNELKQQRTEFDIYFNKIKTEKNICAQKLQDLKAENANLNERAAELVSFNAELKSSVNTIKMHCTEYQNTIKKLEKTNLASNSDNELLLLKNADLNKQIHVIQAKIEDFQNEKVQLEQKSTQINERMRELSAINVFFERKLNDFENMSNNTDLFIENNNFKLLNDEKQKLFSELKSIYSNEKEFQKVYKLLNNIYCKFEVLLQELFKYKKNNNSIKISSESKLRCSPVLNVKQEEKEKCSVNKDRKSRRHSTHDETRHSFFSTTTLFDTQTVAVQTVSNDNNCSCEAMNNKIKQLSRENLIQKCQINNMIFTEQNNPLHSEVDELKKTINQANKENYKLRMDINKMNLQMQQSFSIADCVNCLQRKSKSTSAQETQTNPETKIINMSSNGSAIVIEAENITLKKELQVLQSNYNTAKKLCQIRKTTISDLQKELNSTASFSKDVHLQNGTLRENTDIASNSSGNTCNESVNDLNSKNPKDHSKSSSLDINTLQIQIAALERNLAKQTGICDLLEKTCMARNRQIHYLEEKLQRSDS